MTTQINLQLTYLEGHPSFHCMFKIVCNICFKCHYDHHCNYISCLFTSLDLALGDAHVIAIDDKESRDKGSDKVG